MVRLAGYNDDILMQALEAGADDVQEEAGETIAYTDPRQLAKIRNDLQAAGLEVSTPN